jgi:hypothetical protein
MSLAYNSAMSLALALFLLVGVGCKEQEAKSKEKGKDITQGIKNIEKSVQGDTPKVEKDLEQAAPENK